MKRIPITSLSGYIDDNGVPVYTHSTVVGWIVFLGNRKPRRLTRRAHKRRCKRRHYYD